MLHFIQELSRVFIRVLIGELLTIKYKVTIGNIKWYLL